MCISDWSSDVCSSDLNMLAGRLPGFDLFFAVQASLCQKLELQRRSAATALPQPGAQRHAFSMVCKTQPASQHVVRNLRGTPFHLAATYAEPLSVGRDQHARARLTRGRTLGLDQSDQNSQLTRGQQLLCGRNPLVHQAVLRPGKPLIASSMASGVAGAFSWGSSWPSCALATASRMALKTLNDKRRRSEE